MKKFLIILSVLPLILGSCIPEETVQITPVLEKEKKISFIFSFLNNWENDKAIVIKF